MNNEIEYNDTFCYKCGKYIKVEVGCETQGVLCDECYEYDSMCDYGYEQISDADPGL